MVYVVHGGLGCFIMDKPSCQSWGFRGWTPLHHVSPTEGGRTLPVPRGCVVGGMAKQALDHVTCWAMTKVRKVFRRGVQAEITTKKQSWEIVGKQFGCFHTTTHNSNICPILQSFAQTSKIHLSISNCGNHCHKG